ncbi:MAG: hypothetical protein H0S80_05835 [Desulfovibrionaceae bacterium]|nr:hypothetical protein [Desulfovibrionaceae bacterium]
MERHIKLDAMLPDFASFFYVIELPSQKYRFMGRHQANVSGYSNEEFMECGIELFLSRIHPEDAPILLNEIYPSYAQILADFSAPQRTELQLQYNYRFKRKGSVYLNLMEQVYVLELDDAGGPALMLGNVIELDGKSVLPVRFVCKRINEFGCPEILYSKTFASGFDQMDTLTGRELEILCKLAHGNSSKEIGELLSISRHTVDTHRRNLLRKMECKSVVELVRVAFNNGLL